MTTEKVYRRNEQGTPVDHSGEAENVLAVDLPMTAAPMLRTNVTVPTRAGCWPLMRCRDGLL